MSIWQPLDFDEEKNEKKIEYCTTHTPFGLSFSKKKSDRPQYSRPEPL